SDPGGYFAGAFPSPSSLKSPLFSASFSVRVRLQRLTRNGLSFSRAWAYTRYLLPFWKPYPQEAPFLDVETTSSALSPPFHHRSTLSVTVLFVPSSSILTTSARHTAVAPSSAFFGSGGGAQSQAQIHEPAPANNAPTVIRKRTGLLLAR